jgi:hypothetical protein
MDGSAPTSYADALARLDRRIELEIRRLRARYQLSIDEFRGLYVSDEQVDNLVAAVHDGSACVSTDPPGPIAAASRLGAPWTRLASTFVLSALEQDLLLLALAPEIDLKYETLYAYLNNDVTRKWPTVELARRLLAAPHSGHGAVAAALAPESPLRTHGLIETIEPPAARPTHLNAGFALRSAVSRFLLGNTLTPAAAVTATTAAGQWNALPFSLLQIERLQGVARILGDSCNQRPVVALIGDRGSGRELAAHALAYALRLPLRKLDFSCVRRAGTAPAGAVAVLAVELHLEPAALCVSGIDALCDRDGRLQPDARDLLGALDRTDGPLILLATKDAPWRDTIGRRRALTIEFGIPDFAQRLHLWKASLRAAEIELPDDVCAALADRFRLGPAQIDDAVSTARDCASFESRTSQVDISTLLAAARAQSHDRMNGLASKVVTMSSWDDLVLPVSTRARLQELSAAIQNRHIVYADWGFAQRVACGTGIKALFAGASGTGKTMAAGVIARELGLDLYKIDLAGVVSKYIGETEKNLDRIFGAASSANAVLFFDEADAVFGKRSEVKDAHDRYANVEAAYLLQKLEDHDGVVILASNLKRNIDDAFARRLHYVVDFPKPDATERELLWRGMFPRTAPLDDDVDFAFLARQFELAGGDIRNVVLDAAFLAACAREAIGMRHIVQALSRQLAKQGKTPSRVEFGRYFGLLDPKFLIDQHDHVDGCQVQR